MPHFETSQQWLEQSSLLLKARPTTTKTTTRYTIASPDSTKRRKPKTTGDASQATDAEAASATPRAVLVLRTYDPVSGVSLKYQTTKEREVGRLISTLGKLGRDMAALPEVAEDAVMADAPASVDKGSGTPTSVPPTDAAKGGQQQGAGGGGGGGAGKKKKKGKK